MGVKKGKMKRGKGELVVCPHRIDRCGSITEGIAAFKAAAVVEQVLIDGVTELRAGRGTGSAADQCTKQRTAEGAEGDANRPADQAEGGACLSASHGTCESAGGSADETEGAAGFLCTVTGDDSLRLALWTEQHVTPQPRLLRCRHMAGITAKAQQPAHAEGVERSDQKYDQVGEQRVERGGVEDGHGRLL